MNKKPNKGDRTAEDTDEISSNTNPGTPSEPKSDAAGDKEHKAAERAHWAHQQRTNNITLGISIFALAGAIGGGIISTLALKAAIHSANEAARQANAAFADQRPWLRVDLNLVGFRFTDDLHAEITYEVKTKNIGRSPAQNVQSQLGADVITENSAINSIPAQKEQCALAKRDAEQARWPGAFIFPQDEGVGTLGIAGIGRAGVGPEAYPNAWPSRDKLMFQIVGCFDYTLSSNEHGQTGFTYRLGRKVIDTDHVDGFAPKPGIVPLQGILFQRDPFSGGYMR